MERVQWKQRMRRKSGCSGKTTARRSGVRAFGSWLKMPRRVKKKTLRWSATTGKVYLITLIKEEEENYQQNYCPLDVSWTFLPGCAWTVSIWQSTRSPVSWMWIWSCAACLMRTCPLTWGPLSAAWCCTCMWTVTLRNRSHLSNTHDSGLKFPQRSP